MNQNVANGAGYWLSYGDEKNAKDDTDDRCLREDGPQDLNLARLGFQGQGASFGFGRWP